MLCLTLGQMEDGTETGQDSGDLLQNLAASKFHLEVKNSSESRGPDPTSK